MSERPGNEIDYYPKYKDVAEDNQYGHVQDGLGRCAHAPLVINPVIVTKTSAANTATATAEPRSKAQFVSQSSV